jgi:hypothetical protein
LRYLAAWAFNVASFGDLAALLAQRLGVVGELCVEDKLFLWLQEILAEARGNLPAWAERIAQPTARLLSRAAELERMTCSLD